MALRFKETLDNTPGLEQRLEILRKICSLCEEKRAQLPKAPKLVLAIMPVTNTFSGSVAGIDQGLRTELHRNPGFWRSTSEYVLYAEDLGISLDGSCKRLATGAMLNQL